MTHCALFMLHMVYFLLFYTWFISYSLFLNFFFLLKDVLIELLISWIESLLSDSLCSLYAAHGLLQSLRANGRLTNSLS